MLKIFVCLFLAHVLIDFVFQNNFMYKLKTKSKYGLYIHVGSFFVLSFLLCVPFSFNPFFLLWLFFVTCSHFLIDKIKLFFQRNIIQKELVHYFIDQSIHVLILCSFFVFFRNIDVTSLFFELTRILFGLTSTQGALLFFFKVVFSIYVAYGISVILYYYDRTVDLQVEMLKHNYFSMLVRVLIFLLLIGKLFFVGIFAILVLRQILKMRLIYDGRRFFIENLTLLIYVGLFIPIRIFLVGGCY